MMFIVDGTGSDNDEEYRADMACGFCKQLEKLCSGVYWRGPSLLGLQTAEIADSVVASTLAWKMEHKQEKLFLAGHSRGGAAVIFAAQALRKISVRIDAMFLYDAVDRTMNPFRNADTIPDNVQWCFHAMRERSLMTYYSAGVDVARDDVARLMGYPTGRRTSTLESIIDAVIASPPKAEPAATVCKRAAALMLEDSKMKLVMRTAPMRVGSNLSFDFGNCGTRGAREDRLVKKTFLGSHGAIGGAPITDSRAPKAMIDADRAAKASVNAWMGGFLVQQKAYAYNAV